MADENIDGGVQNDTNTPGVDQTETPGPWYEGLPENLTGDERITQLKDVGELAEAFRNALDSAPRPPESADGYEIEFDEGVEIDTDFLSWFKATAHELGITAEQAQGLAKAWTEGIAIPRITNQAQSTIETLQTEWGGDFDKNIKLADRAARALLDDEGMEEFRKSGLASNVHVVRMFQRLGSVVSEDVLEGGPSKGAKDIPRLVDGTPMVKFGPMNFDD
jgi:hypothetical protein